jgi:hypothetical protein
MRKVITPIARVLLVLAALGFVVNVPRMISEPESPTSQTNYADGFDWH